MASEKRLARRLRVEQKVQIRWAEECGRERTAAGACIDITRRGMAVMVRERIPLGTQIHLREKELQLIGMAVVRNQREERGWYQTGLEFCGALLTPHEVLNRLEHIGVEDGQQADKSGKEDAVTQGEAK